MTEVPSSRNRRRRIKAAIALSAAAGTVGVVAFSSMSGSVRAQDTVPARAHSPATLSTVSPFTLATFPPLTFGTIPPLTIGTLPPFTLVTIPPLTILGTIPPLTLVTVPPTDPATTDETTTTAETTTTTEAPSTTPTTEPATTNPAGPSDDTIPPFLVIHTASVDCAGGIHISYETGGNPEPAPTVNHIIMMNPLSNPTGFAVQETLGQPVTGNFDVALQAPVAESYRVFVTADFLPDDPNDLVLADQADAVLDPSCPAPTTTTPA